MYGMETISIFLAIFLASFDCLINKAVYKADTFSMEVDPSCKCKSTCSTKRKNADSARGCPCKSRDSLCTENCKCGTNKTPCRNRVSSKMKRNQYRWIIILKCILYWSYEGKCTCYTCTCYFSKTYASPTGISTGFSE